MVASSGHTQSAMDELTVLFGNFLTIASEILDPHIIKDGMRSDSIVDRYIKRVRRGSEAPFEDRISEFLQNLKNVLSKLEGRLTRSF